jgi:hypothetical protein
VCGGGDSDDVVQYLLNISIYIRHPLKCHEENQLCFKLNFNAMENVINLTKTINVNSNLFNEILILSKRSKGVAGLGLSKLD